ncbi:hypothetical protein IRJ41_008568 [Triplophysa rosa]|uniref:Uncharacterized protein n=1 Tax=Triplophysa rosa TaxID=992332 RepID=A0A9W7WZF4_TRIRA|nr:hypothetical protein IRJ41_008568 [Triplophysa rosa]
MDAGERPMSEDRRHMVKVIVDSMREHSLNPTRKDCTVVARDITDVFPQSFLDKTEEGETIGSRGHKFRTILQHFGYKKEEAFLLSWKFLLSHFTSLTGIDLCTRLHEDLDSKGKRLLEFFRGQIKKWNKNVKAVLKEALKEDREGTDLAAMLVIMAHFNEAEETLFVLADVTSTPADADAQLSLPITPRLIMLGDTLYSANKWMLSIEGHVEIPHSPPMPDFTTAFAVLFASFYVFNIEYQVEAVTTLEFVQRFLVRINPESSKSSAKVQRSQKTGKSVHRKRSYMNPRVISFIRDFIEFDWQNN